MEQHRFGDKRVDERVPVFHRARAVGPGGRPVSLVIVDFSGGGLMARCDQELDRGTRLQINLPVAGICFAIVRWSLGGRVGCAFEEQINAAIYPALLSALAPQGR